MPGKIILIEGTDSSGKETQAKKLIERLTHEGFPCETMSFPRYDTPTGMIIKQYLNRKFGDPDEMDPRVASLLYAADRVAAKGEIEEIINSGTHLISDRYVESNMAHQGGKEKNPKKRQEIFNFIWDLEYKFLELPLPSYTIFLRMPYEIGMELRKNRNVPADGHESNPDHLRRAEETYLELSEMFQWKKIECAPDGTMKSLRSVEDIGEEVYQKVEEIIKQ